MSCCPETNAPACPCEGFVHPLLISNPPGLDAIAYRLGDYATFRRALLTARAGEDALSHQGAPGTSPPWRPGAHGDLAVQMVEWWAYLADLLTFYNERAATQSYLRTADLPESVNRLIRLLGYRPRPGIGATGIVAAIATGPNRFTLPKGFGIQSKPGPGKQPQTFELDADVTITPPVAAPGSAAAQGVAVVSPAPSGDPVPLGSTDGDVVVAGTTSAVKPGDRVLLLPIDAGNTTDFALATASAVSHGKDPQGGPVTKIGLTAIAPTPNTVSDVRKFHLLSPGQSSQVWQYPAEDDAVIAQAGTGALAVDLNAIARGIQDGDPIVIEYRDKKSSPIQGRLATSTEAVWYANPLKFTPGTTTDYTGIDPSVPPPTDKSGPPGIPIPHTRMTIATTATKPVDSKGTRANYLVRYGWKDVGPLIVVPDATVGGTDAGATGTGSGGTSTVPGPTLQAADGVPFPVDPGATVLVEDVNGAGAKGIVANETSMQLVEPVPTLLSPLRTFFNVLPVSRGKTVLDEVLGSGNALIPGQDFALQKAPVTYLQDGGSKSGDNYGSTVRVWVNGLEWREVRSFYGQPPAAQVFVTREDEAGKTHVVFGDGVNGARLSTGVDNVVADYRYGSGAESPDAGALTVVLKPWPGLRSIRNPLAVGGGADPDPPGQVRALAPRSVMTFGRAVSVDDFEVIAAQTPGVARAKAAVSFDPQSQRPRVTVWVGDDPAAVDAVQAAFAATSDPNRPPRVLPALAVVMVLRLTIVTDPRYDPKAVRDAATAGLVDPDRGVLGLNRIVIGQAIYDSQIYAACLSVPGVVAVHSLGFAVQRRYFEPIFIKRAIFGLDRVAGSRGINRFPVISRVWIRAATTCGGQRHDPGEGAYLLLPVDAGHFRMDQEVAS